MINIFDFIYMGTFLHETSALTLCCTSTINDKYIVAIAIVSVDLFLSLLLLLLKYYHFEPKHEKNVFTAHSTHDDHHNGDIAYRTPGDGKFRTERLVKIVYLSAIKLITIIWEYSILNRTKMSSTRTTMRHNGKVNEPVDI